MKHFIHGLVIFGCFFAILFVIIYAVVTLPGWQKVIVVFSVLTVTFSIWYARDQSAKED